MNANTSKKWYQRIKLPLGVSIAICALPVVMTGLFYALRSFPGVMGWASEHFSAPVRGFMGMLSSIYPLSIMEILCTAAGIWLIYYIIRSIMVTVRRRGKLKILGRRFLPVVVAAVYIYSLFCWLWSSGYHAPGFAEKNGFTGGGVSVEDLALVTRAFAEKANELAPLMERDADGRYIGDRNTLFAASTEIYQDIAAVFPCLDGRIYEPKPMFFYSWLMSRTGYTGVYFALTGESNVNTRMPIFLMPATVAHELAHQLGVFAEDEASFVGIAACLSSGAPVYEYAGYLSALMYLMNALFPVDSDAWWDIGGGFCEEVNRDWQDNYDYWQSQKRVETGVGFLDRILTSVTTTVSDAVDVVYDGYLKSQNQELGLRSYGACVDLLVEYYTSALSQ